MQNKIPTGRGLLAGLAVKMLAGLRALGAILGITQITPERFESDLDAFNTGLGAYYAARSSRQSASTLYRTKVAELTNWLRVVRGVLTGRFGDQWNTMWAQAGFVQPSTAVPRRLQDRLSLALSLIGFFTANPSYEVENMRVTAAQGKRLRDAVVDAQDARQTQNVAVKTALDVLRGAQQVLVAAMRYVIKILTGALGKDDPRWEAFGLNIPGTQTAPPQPTGLHATITGSNILLACDATPLATRYRWRRKVLGLDNKFKFALGTVDPMAMFEDIAAGITMEIVVQAVNGDSPGVASEPIVVTMTAAAAPASAAKPAGSLPELVPNGATNGDGALAISRLN